MAADEPTLGPGLGPTNEPTQLEQEPGGQLHGTGEPDTTTSESPSSSSSGVKSAAKNVGSKAASTLAKTATSDAGLTGLALFLAKLEGWTALRILKLLGGIALAYLGLRQLAAAAGANIPSGVV